MRRRTFLISLPAVVAACTPVREPGSEPAPTPTVIAPEVEAIQDVDSPTNTSVLPWKWDRGPGGWGETRAQRTTFETPQGRYELGLLPRPPADVQTHERFGITYRDLEDHVLWEAELSRPFVPAGAMARTEDRLYATHHSAIASGGHVSSIDMATGRVLWTTRLRALGSIAHDKYRNETQIEVDARGVVVYGNEAQGEYTEILDPDTGHTRSVTTPDPVFARLTWEGKGPDAPYEFPKGPSELAIDDTHYVLTSQEALGEPARLERYDGHELAWTTGIRNEGSCGAASMRVASGYLWVAYHCVISSGTQLLVVDPASGEVVQEVTVHGLGPVAHSEYFSEVQLDVVHGHVVVRGREAAGRYIEVIEPETLMTQVNLTFRD